MKFNSFILQTRSLIQLAPKALGLLAVLFLVACSHNDGDSTDPKWLGPNDKKPTKPYSDAEECKDFINKLPGDFLHGYAEVLENPADAKSPKLKIFYYGRILPGKEPVVFYNGGPGGDSHSTYQVLNQSKLSDPLWKTSSLILIDQRGNGCSSGYPQGSSDEVIDRLRFYGSTQIVYDSEVIRKHLFGDKPWRAAGQSYGAWIVHRYATVAPEGLSGAFAHANVINTDGMVRGANRIASQNRVFEAYFQRYPDDRTAVQILRAALPVTKCYKSSISNDTACGFEVIEGFTQRLGFVPQWTWIHKWLSIMTKDGQIDETVVNDYLTKVVFYGAAGDPSNKKGWMGLVLANWDRNFPSFNHTNCETIYTMLRAQGEKPEDYLLHECMASVQQDEDFKTLEDERQKMSRLETRFGNDHLTIEAFKAALAAHATLPFYLYSGDLDPFVPKASFTEEVAALAERIKYMNFTNSGHDGFYTEHQFAVDTLN